MRRSASFGRLPIQQPSKANNEKVFDFRPRFYDQGTRDNDLVKAPTNLRAGRLPKPFSLGHDSWLPEREPVAAPEDYPAVVAAAEAAGVAALHTESSQGTSGTNSADHSSSGPEATVPDLSTPAHLLTG